MEDKDGIVLNKPKKGEKHPCLESKRALKALHQKCLEYVAQRNVSYIDQPILTELLGGSEEVKPNIVAEIMTYMVSMNMVQLVVGAENTLMFKPIEENKDVDLNTLTKDEHLVYTRIQHADNQGIWSQNLAKNLNMGKVVLDKCLKSLESKRIIKRVKSVKYNTRIIYMLYNLEPSADLTGGPWYTDDKELDVAFVSDLLDVTYRIVDKKSFPPPIKVESGTKRTQTYYQPTYRGYATAEDVYDYIIRSKVLQDDSIKDTFGVSHVHKLLEVLCYNNQIQKRTDGLTYRSILSEEDILPPEQLDEYYDAELIEKDQADAIFGHKGYTEAPCGRCPVFKICGNSGEDVSAATCKYWDEWTSKVTAPVEYF